jgi:hypothetical protein
LGPQKRLFRHAHGIRAVLTCSWQNEALNLTRWTNFQDKSVTWMHRSGVLPSLIGELDGAIELDRLKDELAIIGRENCGWHALSWAIVLNCCGIRATRPNHKIFVI